MSQPINFLKAFKSFRFALAGIYSLFKNENNARIHLMMAILVTIAGILFSINTTEWICITIVIGLVWAAEAFNTSIEKLADVVSPGYQPEIKSVKDLAAAGVLILTIAAVITGIFIFLPKIILLLGF